MTHKLIHFIATRPSIEIMLEIRQRLLPRRHKPNYLEPSQHFIVVKIAGNQVVAFWRGSGHGTWTKRQHLAFEYITEYQARRDLNSCRLDHQHKVEIRLIK